MDMTAFYLHIASELGTNVCLYSRDNVFIRRYSKRIDLQDPLLEQKELRDFLLSGDASGAPMFSTFNKTITYALAEDSEARYLIGPVLTDPSIGIRRNMTLPDIPGNFIPLLNQVPFFTLISHVLLLHNCINPPGLSSLELVSSCFSSEFTEDGIQKKSTMEMFGRREFGELHNPYKSEARLLSGIEAGDVDAVKSTWEEEASGKLGITAKDPYRSGKNLAIGTVVLSSRAAIRGGLHYEAAFSLCDAYEMQIEELRDMTKLEALVKGAEISFTEMVREIRAPEAAVSGDERYAIIESCIDYIFTHLHQKLTVQEIAARLHVHPNYLSSFFHKVKGVPLYQYILNEKIRLAKNLLIYSPYSFLEIAHYLGFSSQSHMGTVFKKQTGYTLKKFRETYGAARPQGQEP